MRAGKRRSLIELQAPVRTKQANGSVLQTWETFAKVWACIEVLRGYERSAACASWPAADNKITFKYIPNVLPTMRVIFRNVAYSILYVNNVEQRNRDIELTCNSGVTAQ